MSVTQRATLFIVLVCAVLLGMDGWRSWSARATALGEMRVATDNLARAASQQADDTFVETEIVLNGVADQIRQDGTTPAALARLHQVMSERTAQLPQIDALSVFDASGLRIATSRARLAPLHHTDREYFVYLRDHPGHAPYIGVPIRSRTSGRWIIPVARRIDRPDGTFAGVALATIDVAYFSRFYDSLQIGTAGAIAMVLDNGTLLVRRPFADRFVGEDITRSHIFRAYQTQQLSGTLMIQSKQDGVVRLNSYRQLEHFPVFVAVALSRDEGLAGWRHDMLLHLIGVLCLVCVLGLVGWRLVQQIELRGAAEAALRKSDRELTQLNETLRNLALSDGLTGLANRRHFDAALAHLFDPARAAPFGSVALIMLDVDYFKQFNDTYGHLAGDDCLRTVSRQIRLTGARRADDLVARYGGEEIAILLPRTALADAVQIAEQISASVRGMKLPHAGNPLGIVTVSAGVSACLGGARRITPAQLVTTADHALYAAKRRGRNQVVCLHAPASA